MKIADTTWAEIDMSALRHNYNYIRKKLNKETKICCIVKANAYGHGAVEIANALQNEGADYFAVANYKEALELRENGITKPILILGYVPICKISLMASKDISIVIYSMEYASLVKTELENTNQTIKVHIKVDTGMNRIGFSIQDEISLKKSLDDIKILSAIRNFTIEGIMTHLSMADMEDGKDYTNRQISLFENIVKEIENNKIEIPIKHCLNSAGIENCLDKQFNMVRPGISLYGISPNTEYKPVFTLKTTVTLVKQVPNERKIGYGGTYITNGDQKIATLALGYADGFLRTNTGSTVFINNKPAKIVGKICMDQIMVDATNIDDISIGCEAIIFGKNGNSVEEVAKINNTIAYEILTNISNRVCRYYLDELV